jgi:hypothetical protein
MVLVSALSILGIGVTQVIRWTPAYTMYLILLQYATLSLFGCKKI